MIWHKPKERNEISIVMELVLSEQVYRGMQFLCAWAVSYTHLDVYKRQVLGGMMSIDFGGPFNKAAYVFGTASIASGQFDIMASVMIGGMVPPIGIALATTFFKSRFTKSEQQTTLTNFIMGLSFITEGAIPFAASDPLRIIPPCVVGSAAAGALSMAFGCGSRAPHGGIFVVGIIENAPMFVAALAVGSVLAMLGIVLLKRPITSEK